VVIGAPLDCQIEQRMEFHLINQSTFCCPSWPGASAATHKRQRMLSRTIVGVLI
jgi:hypothetical protein